MIFLSFFSGTGMKMPTAMIPQPAPVPTPAPTVAAPIATQCFMLSNMFNPATETDPDWDKDLAMEIAEECSQYGGVVHVKVDKTSTEGNVYVKSVSISAASLAVQSLHGRYFAGKEMIYFIAEKIFFYIFLKKKIFLFLRLNFSILSNLCW